MHDAFLHHLLQTNLLLPEQANNIMHNVQENKLSIVANLIKTSVLSPRIIAEQLATHLSLSFFDLSQQTPETIVQDMIDATFIRQHRVLPLFIQDKQLHLAISEPKHLDYISEIKFHTDLNICPVIVEWDKLDRLTDNWLNYVQYQQFSAFSLDKAALENDDRIIAWVEHLLKDAIQKNASDIHIEPYKTAYRVRFRLDGLLHKVTQLSLELGQRITARLKIMSRLNVAERRLPQDGRFTFEIDTHVSKDCRISICPTLFGEKTVLRILDGAKVSLNIEDLGLETQQKTIFLDAIQKPQGMVLVTGPTGSGKTVTLYSALNFLNSLEKNICTVEEPIEITLPGIHQTNVDTKIDLSFAKVLRTFLRQDPDILMVGEIRDQETAETAVKAAQTGHLVFSTLHTNSAIETLTRLALLGISPFNIAYSVQLIIAQRLVRKLCPRCKREKFIDRDLALYPNSLKDTFLYEASGCEHCSNGYVGRIAIFECLPISPELSAIIAQEKPVQDIVEFAQKIGIVTLRESAINKVRQGITSLEEVQRVIC